MFLKLRRADIISPSLQVACITPRRTGTEHTCWDHYCCCCLCVASVVSDSVRPHRRQPTRLLRPWDSPGKDTGVGCHLLLQCMKSESEREVAQSCLTLCNPLECSLPGSSIHGIFQARVLEWGATVFCPSLISFSFLLGPHPTAGMASQVAQWVICLQCRRLRRHGFRLGRSP